MEFELWKLVGACALAVLVIGWLVVSFSQPSPKRTVIEWLSTSAMYGALLTLFVHLSQGAMESDSTVALIAFGFLAVLFAGGLSVSLYQTLASSRAGGSSGSSATN